MKNQFQYSLSNSNLYHYSTYADIKKVPKLADALPPTDPMTAAGDPAWRRYKSCAVVGNSGGGRLG